MTSSGVPPLGASGVDEPDWIDQILERATAQVESTKAAEPVTQGVRDAESAASTQSSESIVPSPATVASEPSRARSATTAAATTAAATSAAAAAATAAASAASPVIRKPAAMADELAEIRWVDAPQVTPASTPIVTPPATPAVAAVAALVPEAVGRSAWDDGLASVGNEEPEGWDQLSWEDLDGKTPAGGTAMHEPTSYGRLIREWGPVLFAAVAIALFVRLVLVQAYHIPSSSMVPTLETGDRVVVNRLSYEFGEIDRGQVVVFAKPQGQEGENDLIKRVIGLPGETVRFDSNKVYINGLRVDEPYLLEQDSTRPRLMIPNCAQVNLASDLCQIPQGHVFVMGDNRNGSSDSRVFGPVPIESVVGRAFLRVWPLNNIGEL